MNNLQKNKHTDCCVDDYKNNASIAQAVYNESNDHYDEHRLRMDTTTEAAIPETVVLPFYGKH